MSMMPCIPYLIVTIHTIQTIYTVISNIPCPTDLHTIPTIHTIPTTHAIHTHTYHTYQTYHTFQTCHTRPTIHTIHTQHTIPHPHHTTGGGGGQCHTPTTQQGGEGEDLIGASIWDPSQGGRGGWQGLVHIYTILCYTQLERQEMTLQKHGGI